LSAEQRARERKRRQEERRRREQERRERAEQARTAERDEDEAAAAAAARVDRIDGPFAGGAITAVTPVASVEQAMTEAVAAATASPQPAALPQPVAFPEQPQPSTARGATPVLAGLLALSVLLLGLAAMPRWRIRAGTLGGLVAGRRLELGVVGSAVLLIAVVGLIVTVF
jgi:hypothetical protein